MTRVFASRLLRVLILALALRPCASAMPAYADACACAWNQTLYYQQYPALLNSVPAYQQAVHYPMSGLAQGLSPCGVKRPSCVWSEAEYLRFNPTLTNPNSCPAYGITTSCGTISTPTTLQQYIGTSSDFMTTTTSGSAFPGWAVRNSLRSLRSHVQE